jgi:hypothetical protein
MKMMLPLGRVLRLECRQQTHGMDGLMMDIKGVEMMREFSALKRKKQVLEEKYLHKAIE